MILNPEDIGVVRDLVTLARARGWTHLTYGERGTREHVWRSPAPCKAYTEKVSLWHGGLEYRKVDAHAVDDVRHPESAQDAREWLRLLGLVPSVAEFAEAVLTPDADPRWYVEQMAQDVTWHGAGAS